MFRLPRALLDAEVARQYCHMDAASMIETSDHVIVSLYLDRDPDNYWVEADDRRAPTASTRSVTLSRVMASWAGTAATTICMLTLRSGSVNGLTQVSPAWRMPGSALPHRKTRPCSYWLMT